MSEKRAAWEDALELVDGVCAQVKADRAGHAKLSDAIALLRKELASLTWDAVTLHARVSELERDRDELGKELQRAVSGSAGDDETVPSNDPVPFARLSGGEAPPAVSGDTTGATPLLGCEEEKR